MDNEASEAVFYTTTESVMLPLAETQQEDRVLYGFKWRDDLRPKSKEEIIPSWLQDLNFHTTLRARIDACYEKEGGAARKMSWRHEIWVACQDRGLGVKMFWEWGKKNR